jgi:hypothetical protein
LAVVYSVLYAPKESRNPHLPIQRYTIIGNPRNQAWRSKAKHNLFTAVTADKGNFVSFRAERVLSVNFAGVKLVKVAIKNKSASIAQTA